MANPRNTLSPLYKKLTRLFSGPIVDYRQQNYQQLRGKKVEKYGERFKSTYGQAFKRVNYNPFELLRYKNMAEQNRFQRYADFNAMEFMPELSSALDVYSDEITTSSPLNPIMKVECSDQRVKAVLEELYFNILNVEFNLFGWVRTMCKYGDYFLYLDIDETKGVRHIIGLPTEEVERLEGEDKNNPEYIRFHWTVNNMTFENWQMGHFRILGNDKYAPYGSSVFDGARVIFKQLTLMENAMMSYRIVRAPERKVYYIDIGNIDPDDVEQYMQQIISTQKRNYLVNNENGEMDYRFNPASIDEDIFIPVRQGSNTKIESLPGGQYVGVIDDVKYLRDKLFSAIKIPASYLSRGDGMGESEEALSSKDLRFSRTVQRLQRSVISELEKIGIIHLYVLGFRDEDLIKFRVKLGNPSKVAELQELEHWRTKFDIAAAATEGYFSRRWVGEHIFGLSEFEMRRLQEEMFRDKWLDAQFEAAASGESSGGGDLGSSLGADEDLESADAADESDTEAEEAPESDSALLAAPPKRDDNAYLTPHAKGKSYTPVVDDKRDMGARKRHFQAKFAREKSSSARRNIFPGTTGISRNSKGIMKEEKSTYDKREEESILLAEYDIDKIVEGLEKAGELLKEESVVERREKIYAGKGVQKPVRLPKKDDEDDII